MTDTRPRTFTAITDHPLPLSDQEVEEFANDHPQLDPDDIHVDVLHEDYITLLAENAEWHVFTVDLYGFGGRIYVWNGALGEGLAVETGEWAAGNLAEAFALYRQTVAGNVNRDELPVTPAKDAECPYCGGTLASSVGPSGTITQRCTNCGEHRSVG